MNFRRSLLKSGTKIEGLQLHQASSLQKAMLPQQPPTLGNAVKWIARLGGQLGRKSGWHPGLKTFWRGYQRIRDAANILLSINQENLGKA